MRPIWTIKGGVFDPALCFADNPAALRILPYCIWGVLNLTPDSFFDGGRWNEPAAALVQAEHLLRSGAGILDLGPASTRPGAMEISAEQEIERLAPVLTALSGRRGHLLSVDTWRATSAAWALDHGAEIINDVSACLWEPELAEVVAQYQPGYVLTHNQGKPGVMQDNPHYTNILDEVLAFFDERLRYLTAKGLDETRIMLDPGIGFGKTLEHNLTLLRNLDKLTDLGRPLLLGLSNKSMFGDLLGLDKNERGCATAIASSLAAAAGVIHHRAHDVALHAQAFRLVRALAPV